MFTFTSLIPRPCYPQTKRSCSLSHTPVWAPSAYFEPEESNKSSASLLDTEYMRGSCNENFKTERGP